MDTRAMAELSLKLSLRAAKQGLQGQQATVFQPAAFVKIDRKVA
jgi:hypothetical protein